MKGDNVNMQIFQIILSIIINITKISESDLLEDQNVTEVAQKPNTVQQAAQHLRWKQKWQYLKKTRDKHSVASLSHGQVSLKAIATVSGQ